MSSSINRMLGINWIVGMIMLGSGYAQNYWTHTGNYLSPTATSDSIGVGTSTPGAKLQVNGGTVVGYSAKTAAPTNGAIVNGNVGIGTTTVGSKLQVNGGAAIGYNASTAAPSNGVVISGNVGIGTTTVGSAIQVNGGAAIGYSASTGAPSNGAVVNGNVGIGTTTVGSKLQVNGGAAIGYNASQAAPALGLTVAGPVGLGVATPLSNSKLQVAGYSVFNGSTANIGMLPNLSFMQNSSSMLLAWNRTNAEGEADFINNLGLGSIGGFSFYDIDNSGTGHGLMRVQTNGNVGAGATAAMNDSAFLAINSVMANGVYPVLAFGADPTGVAPSDAAFTNALDSAASRGANGGRCGTVLVPSGQYRINGTLTIPRGVTLQGSFTGPHEFSNDSGTLLLAYYTSGHLESGTPFITMSHTSTVKGLTIRYPLQTVSGDPYPFTFRCNINATIENVNIVNAYNGIDLATNQSGAHYLRNINMCALNQGIIVDQCYEIGRLENVMITPGVWTNCPDPTGLQTYILTHLNGYIFNRTDWEQVTNCFIFEAKRGITFASSSCGQSWCTAMLAWSQGGADECACALYASAVLNPQGVSFKGATFVGADTILTGPITFTDCTFYGKDVQAPSTNTLIYYFANQPTILPLVFTNCKFNWWNLNNNGSPCISVVNNNAYLSLSNCSFYRDYWGQNRGINHISINGGKAGIIGCVFDNPFSISTTGGATYRTSMNMDSNGNWF